MISFKLPPVLDSKSVLLDHIKAKLKQLVIPSVVNDIGVDLCKNKPNDELLKLLQHELLLKEALLNIKINVNIKQKLGSELFAKVSQFDTSLCAQITGMLLELDVITICRLLSDSDALEIAISKAKEEYTAFKQKTSKELVGEDVYSQVLAQYPEPNLAGRLTGILLELDVNVLQHLLEDPQEFSRRLEMANSVIASLGLLLQSPKCKKYADSMQLLATEFWERKNGNHSELCRIQWVVDKCAEYFKNGGLEQAIEKEEKLCKKYCNKSINRCGSIEQPMSLLKLLDVGSCYNPFSRLSFFEVTALDLMPAVSDVFKCDFLSVNISNCLKSISNPCTELPEQYFDIVVFSLLLEYFPSSTQRLKCCKHAYQVLKVNGLLFILTPDSKHATANSKMMKSWNFALASLGFWRTHYQKLKHLHCMSYRKCIDSQVPKSWLSNQQCHKPPEDSIYIPQDFHEYSENLTVFETEERTDSANKCIADTFSDLPDCDIFS